jgi:hypothetical protein
MRIVYSAVTVAGGRSSPCVVIRWYAAVQLQWQSNSVPMTPPLSAPVERLVVRLRLPLGDQFAVLAHETADVQPLRVR